METNLEGKTVLVTNGIESLGRATAVAFAKEGANVLVAGTGHQEQLGETARQVEAQGVRAATAVYDLSDRSQVQSLVEKAVSEFGRLDVVINNSRSAPSQLSLEDISFQLWKTRMGEQLTGTLSLCQAALPGMIERRWGRFVNYIGLAAFQGTDAPSAAAELGLIGMTRGIAREHGKSNITANCIGAAGMETREPSGPFTFTPSDSDPVPRWGTPEEAAFLAVSLASQHSGYVTGQCLLANGGKFFL